MRTRYVCIPRVFEEAVIIKMWPLPVVVVSYGWQNGSMYSSETEPEWVGIPITLLGRSKGSWEARKG